MSVGDIEQTYCRRCKACSDHRVVHENERHSEPDDPESWSIESKSVECGGCRTLSVLERVTSALDEVYGREPYDNGWRVVPEPPAGSVSTGNVGLYLPRRLQSMHRETIEAISGGLRILAAGGIRALIEGACAELGVVDGVPDGSTKRRDTLAGKINGLAEKGWITARNAAHLHELRLAGNEALHQLDEPSPEELRLAIEIVEHLLAQVFKIDSQAKTLETMRTFRKAGSAPPPPPSSPPSVSAPAPVPAAP